MSLRPADWPRAREVFEHALALPASERLPYVAAMCRDNRALRDEVERMLQAHPQAAGFLSTPAAALFHEAGAGRSLEGQRIGPYLLASRIGEGGMGVVYKARDTRLDRTVAIKVLSPDVADDPDARERFDREGRAIAALNHPHICALYDIGEAAGPERAALGPIRFLVMEYLEGEALSDRLARGALPVAQALQIAVQMASALDAAHRAGIVHRDLKPGNVFLLRGGGSGPPTAKLLDFGLAKSDPAAAIVGASTRELVGRDLTLPGTILGTVQYMAPEQIAGNEADTRTDIFAFGSVLYEMLTGRKAFDGENPASLMAAILEHDAPSVSSVQPRTPPQLDRIVATCLAKDPNDRWQTARDLLRELKWVSDGDAAARAAPVANSRREFPVVALAGAALAIAALAIVGITYSQRPSATAAPNISFAVYPPEGTTFPRGTAEMAVSPDGTRLAFVAVSADGRSRLWVRRFDSVAARALDGTDRAAHPFWSPDGRSIGFFASGLLKRTLEAGGPPQVLCSAAVARGATWNRDGIILFAAGYGPIQRVSDTGGVPTPVTTLDKARKERAHAWPVFLPDGRRFLYLAPSEDREQNGIYQGSLDSAPPHRVLAAESNIGLAGAHLFSRSNRSLIAHAFDPDRGQIVGEPITIAEQIAYDNPLRSGGAFSVGASGALAYRSASPDSHLVWFDRTGKEVGAFRDPGDYHHPWLSPDETQVAIERTDAATGQHTIWILDLARGATSRLLFDAAGAHAPVWSPDGARIVFSSSRRDQLEAYSIRADGSDEPMPVSNDGLRYQPTDWSSDGRLLLSQIVRGGQLDLGIKPVSPATAYQPFLETAANERQGQFSPDMRWIAYTSDESGVQEVYVRRYPGADGKWQISAHGGAQPRWRRDGKELFYLASDGKLMAVDVKTGGSRFETAAPRTLFNSGITMSFIDRRNHYVVTRDGQRFLFNVSAEDENAAPITVVLNWQSAQQK